MTFVKGQRRMTFRWADGQHVGTLIRQPDGTFLAETPATQPRDE